MRVSSWVPKVLPAALRAGQGRAHPATPLLGTPPYLLKQLHGVFGGEGGRGRRAGPPVVVAGHGDAVHRAPRVVVALQRVAVKHKEAHVTRHGSEPARAQEHYCRNDTVQAELGSPRLGRRQRPPPRPREGRLRGESGEKTQLLPSSRSSCCDLLHVCCIFSSAEVGIKEVKKSSSWPSGGSQRRAGDRRGTRDAGPKEPDPEINAKERTGHGGAGEQEQEWPVTAEHRAPKAPEYPPLIFNLQSRHPQLLGTPQLFFRVKQLPKERSPVILKGSAVVPGEFTLRTGREIHNGHGERMARRSPGAKPHALPVFWQ